MQYHCSAVNRAEIKTKYSSYNKNAGKKMERMIQSNFCQRIFESFPETRYYKNLIVKLENVKNKFQCLKVKREKGLPKVLRVGARQKAAYLIRT